MKIVYKMFLMNVNFCRYFLLIFLLLIFFFIMNSLESTVSNIIFNKNNSLDNRTIIVSLNDDYSVMDLKSIPYIGNISIKSNNEYEIVFDDYRNVLKFKNEYGSWCKEITYFGNSDENKSVLSYLTLVLKIISYIVLLVLGIVILISIIESFLEFIPDISLLKLMGFSNNKLIGIIFKFFCGSFSILFFFAIFLFKIVLLILNYIFSLFNAKFILSIISFSLLFTLYFTFVLFILFISMGLYLKLKKITPISFVKNNLSL